MKVYVLTNSNLNYDVKLERVLKNSIEFSYINKNTNKEIKEKFYKRGNDGNFFNYNGFEMITKEELEKAIKEKEEKEKKELISSREKEVLLNAFKNDTSYTSLINEAYLYHSNIKSVLSYLSMMVNVQPFIEALHKNINYITRGQK